MKSWMGVWCVCCLLGVGCGATEATAPGAFGSDGTAGDTGSSLDSSSGGTDSGAPGDTGGAGQDTGISGQDTGLGQDTGAPDLPPVDTDGDGHPDPLDNCPLEFNPGQEDADNDASGDVCDADRDGDGILNEADLYPDDPSLPGRARPNVVYGQSSGRLYTMDVIDYAVSEIGAFGFPSDGRSHQVTDIAIDRHGVLYAISYDTLYVCHPETAQCQNLGNLPGSYNGMTLVPRGVLDPGRDVLVGISGGGDWTRLDIDGNRQVQPTILGSYGGGYTSSGDAFSIEGVGTFASVNASGSSSDVIVEVDPSNGRVIREVTTLTGYSGVFGLAGWTGRVFAFDSSGAILEVDIAAGTFVRLSSESVTWWGAGVGTVILN